MAEQDSPAPGPVLARARVGHMVEDVLARAETVAGYLAKGLTPRQAAAQARKPPPDGLGLSRRSADRYVGRVLARLTTDNAIEPRETKRARILHAAHEALKGAENTRDAVAALTLIAKMEGVETP